MLLCSQCGTGLRDIDRFCAACGAAAGDAGAASKDPLLGRTIGGSYVILDLVGVGGMGRVYRAEQRMLGRTVAIKVIHPHLLSDEQSVARFYNEARAASRLNHPNSVSIIDFGRTDDGILYLAMEYLQGRDLARLMREEGPLPFARICEILGAVLAALGEAHVLGVIHRDLKPENVIIERLRTGSDLVKVVDFGLAKLLGAAATVDSSVTSPGLVCGTPDYMSPEQGRGLPLDGRGDLYAVGVMLFELLTEQLPYLADTPTNVVLRHIQDPIPDPREVAPERRIPSALCDVVERALAKQAERRYQTAHEMAEELRRAQQELQPSAREITCPSCGLRSPSNKRFCGECGAALLLHATPTTRPRMSLPPRMAVAMNDQTSKLVARDRELERLSVLRDEALGTLRCACLIGEPGIGKTRLLAEVADRAAAEGDLIVGAGPHDSGAFIPYHPIRTVMLSLLETDGPGLWRKLEDLVETAPLVAAGMREVLEPSGLRGADGRSRAGAVAAALAHALREAMQALRRQRVVLMIDDLHRCDGLSAQVLSELSQHTGESSVLLLIASQQARKEDLPPESELILLRALTMGEARACMAGYSALPPSAPETDERAFVPLYLDQLRALGLAIDGVPHTLPRRLADAVMQRMQRLSLPARRLLQAACVLGNRCSRTQLVSLAELDDAGGLELLKSSGLLAEQDEQIEVVHPFIRDLVEASIPAEARKALHARALEAAADADAPLEVRAHHAYGAGETLSALMLLERMGDLASERGDANSSVLAFRRCLDLVRRELLELGETSLEDAMASFSRKLGNALGRGGDLTGAEGVLREALEFCRPGSIARAHVLLGLGRVVASRKRLRDAYRLLGEALELAILRDDDATQAAVHITVGELRRSESNLVGAVGAFSAALQRLSHISADALSVARAAVELAVTLAQGSDAQAAGEALHRAQELAREADAPYLEARAAAALAELREGLGDRTHAEAHLRHACEAALRAGDAGGFARYDALLVRAETALTDRPRAGASDA